MTEILTTHAGSLPRSPELIAANAARPVGGDGLTPAPPDGVRGVLRPAVGGVVGAHRDGLIDLRDILGSATSGRRGRR